MATQADVARLAGVSTAVVSYVLNDGPRRVAPATATRVKDAMVQLGYRPNLAARTLRVGSSRLIGLVLPDISNPYYGALAKAVDRTARAHGFDVIVGNTLGDSALRLIQHLDALQVAGIVVAAGLSVEDEAAARRVDTPTVTLDDAPLIGGGVAVVSDLYAGARLAVRHLLEHGHRTVAFLGALGPDQPRYAGWRDELVSAGAPPGGAAVAGYSREGGLAGTVELLARHGSPTAIFASSDLIAIGALVGLRRAGLVVPADVSVVSFDDSPETAFALPALSAIRQPIDTLAEEAVAVLIDADHLASGRHRYPVELIERDSVGPPPAP